MADFITRFAPSPTGELHLGSAYSALVAFEAAQTAGGRFLLRIEDIDHTRCRPEFTDMIIDALHWLGVRWETPVRRQSEHIDAYRAALVQLEARGLVYRCFKSRAEIEARFNEVGEAAQTSQDDDFVYRGPIHPLTPEEDTAKITSGAAFAWRLSLKAVKRELGDAYNALTFVETDESGATQTLSATPDMLGDVVLWRKDGAPSYHLAVVYDDGLQNVSHIIRGEDLRTSTHTHILLQALLGLPTPVYRHHRLLVGSDGQRYSKKDKSLTLRALRDAGASPGDIRARIGLPS